jgi:adenylate cyclase
MVSAPIPHDEDVRLGLLRRFEVLDTGPDEMLDRITQLASEVCGVPTCLISLVDSDRQWFKSRVGLDVTEAPREVAFCAHAILGDEIMEVPDALEDPRFHDNPLVTGAPHVRFYAGAPLQVSGASAVGTLCVLDVAPHTLTQTQRHLLSLLAHQVVQALELRAITRELASTTRRAMTLEGYLQSYTPRHVWGRLRAVADDTCTDAVGERVEQVYLFADICDFTAMSTHFEPEQVSRTINWYLQPLIGAVTHNGGDIEKFLGDGFFAVFDDPDSALEAARAIQQISRRQASLAAAHSLPAMQLTVGAHIGSAVRVHVGSDTRRDNTLIGKAINIASRLQGACPPGAVLISDELLAAAAAPVAVTHSASASLRGVAEQMLLHQLVT